MDSGIGALELKTERTYNKKQAPQKFNVRLINIGTVTLRTLEKSQLKRGKLFVLTFSVCGYRVVIEWSNLHLLPNVGFN